MALFNLFKNNDNLSPAMRQALRSTRGIDREQTQRIIVDLQRQTEMLTKKDIGDWRLAWQRAINIENPNRIPLLNIYTDVDIDLHLTGCISQRKGMATKGEYKLVDKTGKKDERATEMLRSEWFADFIDFILDSRYYGHSLIEFGTPVQSPTGTLRFQYVQLVPRRHVIPEYGVIVKRQGDTHLAGVPYREGNLAQWCIEVGRTHDLGLLLKCAPAALSKKNMLAFWDGFGEIFGMPIRIAHTTATDQKERSKIEQMLQRMGAAFYGVFQEGTDIEIKESSRADAYNVYDKRIDKANSDISKGILNQTMTIDSGSSLSQSEVHLEVFQNVVDKDKSLIANTVNDKLLPFMAQHGFPVDGCRFEWDDTEQYTPQDMRTVEQMLVQGGYEIDPKYFIDKYGIPITGRRDLSTLSAHEGDDHFFA
ncbi:MAG: DUF935 domain-containing protein [Paludibacter sp.]|nr:DUF935 domain-containing protein [Bacteroidales bacterium]MCM1069839.1 DUF935 domain-containing protein [Prevotella sp.]MCM1353968.1 DUF935 domain-containing protein [Bacteroides sp.]MCM1443390.1 DUF935 domain-containing protein [Muribaculum sp.]MCM1482093.1 DUF935 domain-containing protein [Paludibacter sp.]